MIKMAITITVTLEDEHLQDLFDNNEIKFSKAKLKRLKEIVNEVETDIQERLEETFAEFIDELVQEEWGE
jgi:hypothetical protein